ncbi:MAG: aminotransferase class I/II-fold pyridoxal phosphate-dependent enzyme [Candidatus Aminicenantes bacterium]|nr:aminotransferase class I/II-fold pyridoxal phosphate-dependent enzyme [Candidatus Aminicenantes bacterium]NIM77601.1 aminotransferase class I/II-fold pyridoxal phosphate-dependent enzyme [Candidatus Aminicenantes bacterium]NIN16915.1 aminotransferase class I/II-fold pyridoxal phosphate-dependent enzyme [Candidatus Aminicenantes bacterium]NIN40808.1 aminotransferase class I/II-fold pyridoxal phosphate-dependent enzyme [Candidatus Aminicenantes bacterium]NIN83612.1 aminotransferase class I/II-
MKVEFFRHSLGKDEKDSLLETLDGLFLTTGPKTRQFEKEFSHYLGVNHTVGLSSCSTGLFFTLKAWGIGAGDQVIVPAMTFIATANAVLIGGAEVMFCDVDKETALIDLNMVEDLLKWNQKVKVVLPVHLYGQMVDMKSLRELADRYHVKILEDSAHCIEGERDGIKPGHLGDAAAFSFYATKNVTCGEGGAVVSNDTQLTDRLRILRLHGMSKSAIDRHVKYNHWDMEVLGYKGNMYDIEAALLLPQLPKIERQWQRREKICRQYENAFDKVGIDFPRTLPGVKSARHLFTIWAPQGKRDAFLEYLQQQEIGVAVNYRAVHLRTYYRETFGFKPSDFPIAEEIGERTLSIPLYPRLEDREVDYVIDKVIEAKEKLD